MIPELVVQSMISTDRAYFPLIISLFILYEAFMMDRKLFETKIVILVDLRYPASGQAVGSQLPVLT